MIINDKNEEESDNLADAYIRTRCKSCRYRGIIKTTDKRRTGRESEGKATSLTRRNLIVAIRIVVPKL